MAAHGLARQRGIEPRASSFGIWHSVQLSYWRVLERAAGIEPAYTAWKAAA